MWRQCSRDLIGAQVERGRRPWRDGDAKPAANSDRHRSLMRLTVLSLLAAMMFNLTPGDAHAGVAPMLAPDSTSLNLKLASSCGGFTRWVLGDLACGHRFALDLAPRNANDAPPIASVSLIRPDGTSLPRNSPGAPAPYAAVDGDQLVLTIPEFSLSPGHYAGHIQASFDHGAALVSAPVTIDVRWPATIAFLLILTGVVVGRLQAFMAGTGKTVADAYHRLVWLRDRASRLPAEYQKALEPAFQIALDQLNGEDSGPLQTAMATLDQIVRALEVASSLVPDPASADPNLKHGIAALEAAVRVGDGPGATAKANALRVSRRW